MGDKDGKEDDFIAVVDLQEGSPTFGRFVASQQVGLKGSMPHHLEYELPSPGQLLYGNAHHHELLILVDFSKPLHPRIVKTVSPPPPYRYRTTSRVFQTVTCSSVIFAAKVRAQRRAIKTCPATTVASPSSTPGVT